MICEHCRSDIVSGYHSPHWCLDYVGPEVMVRVSTARSMFQRPDDVMIEPQLAPGRIGACALCGRPSAPGRLRCPACERERDKS